MLILYDLFVPCDSSIPAVNGSTSCSFYILIFVGFSAWCYFQILEIVFIILCVCVVVMDHSVPVEVDRWRAPLPLWGLEVKLRSTALVSSAFTHGNFLESPSLFRILRTIFLAWKHGLETAHRHCTVRSRNCKVLLSSFSSFLEAPMKQPLLAGYFVPALPESRLKLHWLHEGSATMPFPGNKTPVRNQMVLSYVVVVLSQAWEGWRDAGRTYRQMDRQLGGWISWRMNLMARNLMALQFFMVRGKFNLRLKWGHFFLLPKTTALCNQNSKVSLKDSILMNPVKPQALSLGFPPELI